jgi:hypothetical protein
MNIRNKKVFKTKINKKEGSKQKQKNLEKQKE